MGRQKNQFPIPEVRHPGLAGKVRRQEAIHKSCERTDVARFGEHRLQLALGQENAVELGKAHGIGTGGKKLCRLS
jgi:hypothetical protein